MPEGDHRARRCGQMEEEREDRWAAKTSTSPPLVFLPSELLPRAGIVGKACQWNVISGPRKHWFILPGE